jgi:hypothetical protein
MTRREGGAIIALALTLLAGCTPQPPAEPTRTETPAQPKRPAPARVAQLLNLQADTVITTLGNPVLRKNDNGGEIWLYAHANGCSLDLVLFPTHKILSVAHATTETPKSLTEADCLSAIANTPR